MGGGVWANEVVGHTVRRVDQGESFLGHWSCVQRVGGRNGLRIGRVRGRGDGGGCGASTR